MTAESTVAMVSRCPSCGRDVAWTGSLAALTGSSTVWRIADHAGCTPTSTEETKDR